MKEQQIKDLAVAFFQWWWNQLGSNTYQGFDEWAKTKEGSMHIDAVKEKEPEPYLPANDLRRERDRKLSS